MHYFPSLSAFYFPFCNINIISIFTARFVLNKVLGVHERKFVIKYLMFVAYFENTA